MRGIAKGAAAAACTLALSTAGLAAAAGADAKQKLRVRKSVAALTAEERAVYVGAVKRLKTTRSPHSSLSWYDQFVAWHKSLSMCEASDPFWSDHMRAHAGPMFLPWHRQFLLMFEDALNSVSKERIALPYWDWTQPGSRDAVFRDDFMGGSGDPAQDYAVTTGPFRKGEWRLNVRPHGLSDATATDYLTRNLGPDAGLPDTAKVDAALALEAYDTPPWNTGSRGSFRNQLEGFVDNELSQAASVDRSICGPDGTGGALSLRGGDLHNLVHMWVAGPRDPAGSGAIAGTMGDIMTSPNDPVFFLHHAQIDRVWAQWQERRGVETYLPREGVPNNSLDSVMSPFDEAGLTVAPADVLDVRALGYAYDDSSPTTRRAVRPGAARRMEARRRAMWICRVRTRT